MTDPATDPATGRDPEAVAALDAALPYVESWIAYRVWKARIPGAQYAVRYDGELKLSGAVGLADVAAGEPLTTRHLFRIASHSKMFTGTAILQLVEQGRMRLDAELGEYVDELAGTPVGERSLRELLEHAGGVIRDGEDGDYWQHGRPFPGDEELLAMTRDAGVKSDANSRFDYSNMGYSLLGLAIARVTGRSYDEQVRAEIVARLGLADTDPDYLADRAADYATGHTGFHTSLERRPIAHVATASMASATGFTSTAEDITAFLEAHRLGDDRLLGDRAKRAMQRPGSANPVTRKAGGGYGLGMVVEEIAGRTVVGHSGGYPGHITRTLLDPADGLVVSVLTNSIDGGAGEISTGVYALLDAALQRRGRRSLTAPEPAPLGDTSSYEGRFANLWGVTDIARLGDRLVALSPGQADPLLSVAELEVVDADTLRIVGGDHVESVGELIRYERAADGAVLGIRGSGGMSSWPFDTAAPSFAAPWPELG